MSADSMGWVISIFEGEILLLYKVILFCSLKYCSLKEFNVILLLLGPYSSSVELIRNIPLDLGWIRNGLLLKYPIHFK